MVHFVHYDSSDILHFRFGIQLDPVPVPRSRHGYVELSMRENVVPEKNTDSLKSLALSLERRTFS